MIMSDRRSAETMASEWKEARGVVALRLDQLAEEQRQQREQVETVVAELRELRPYMRGVARTWAALAFVAVTVVGAVLVTMSRHYTLAALQPAALTQTERVEEIADILADIPGGVGNRRQSGRPTVSAVKQALPMVRGIKSAEVEAACLLAPDACRPP